MKKTRFRAGVLSMRGKQLDPCTPVKARQLLSQGKAKIAGYKPFTIVLQYPTGECTPRLDAAAQRKQTETDSRKHSRRSETDQSA
ncbi:MAG: RRXRR domain-containing protein [Proteobacteria bacterium]|uniref:RRXRR domain-containing protein n=1 Tax=Candidatus Avisuccinivibrio stercorigallinarum TaxID=2840704 RepID=A0A9D9D910_9GAMM|nr:RRXRR domain-containing protein [Candidatus Avisuccinivibrio stercorigallinarum]